jgi:hypothetical protein
MNRKYPALGVIATLYKISGILVLVGAILFFILSLVSALTPRPSFSRMNANIGIVTVMSGAIVLIAGGLSSVGLYGFGELLDLMRDIEVNTRSTADDAEATARNTRNTVQLLYQFLQAQQGTTVDNTPRRKLES